MHVDQGHVYQLNLEKSCKLFQQMATFLKQKTKRNNKNTYYKTHSVFLLQEVSTINHPLPNQTFIIVFFKY